MKCDKKFRYYLWDEWIKPILIAAVLALFIRTFIVQPFKIPSNSMYSTFKPGDRIFQRDRPAQPLLALRCK